MKKSNADNNSILWQSILHVSLAKSKLNFPLINYSTDFMKERILYIFSLNCNVSNLDLHSCLLETWSEARQCISVLTDVNISSLVLRFSLLLRPSDLWDTKDDMIISRLKHTSWRQCWVIWETMNTWSSWRQQLDRSRRIVKMRVTRPFMLCSNKSIHCTGISHSF